MGLPSQRPRPAHRIGRVSALLSAALSLLSCLEPRDGHLPSPDGAQTWILISDYSQPTARALVVDSPVTDISLRSGQTIVLAYDLSAQDLQLPLRTAFESVPEGHDLPRPSQGWLLDSSGRWQTAPSPLDVIADFSLPALDLSVCVRRGGCLSQSAPAHCQVPCEVTPPAAPALPNRPCPTEWQATPTRFDGPQLCAPRVPAPMRCGPGTRQAFGTSTCIDLDACSDGPWPSAPADATTIVYVRPGGPAGAGDGSAQAPFANLSQALAVAPRGAAILIGEGVLSESVEITVNDVRILGLCTQRTTIQAPTDVISLNAEGVRVQGLTVRSDNGAAVHVTRTASVALKGVDLISPQGVGVRSRGHLDMQDFRVQAPVGALIANGQARLRGGAVIDGTAARCQGQSDLRLESLTANLSGAPAQTDAVSLQNCGQASLQSVSLHDVPGWGISGGQYDRLEAQDLHVVGAGQGGLVLTEARRTSQTDLQRIYVEAAAGGGLAATTQNLKIEDLALHALPSPGLYLTPPVDPRPDSEFSLDGLWAQDVGTPVLLAHHTPGGPFDYPMRFDDVVISEVRSDVDAKPATSIRQNIHVAFHRLWVDSGESCALFVGCAPTTAHDVTIHAQGRCGAVVESASGTALSRVRITGVSQTALDVVGSDSCVPEVPILTDDLTVVGAFATGVGVTLVAGALWQATRFDVSGYAIGIDASNAGTLRLEDGTLHDNGLGLQLPKHLDAQDVLTRVGFNNTSNLRQR